MTVIPSDKAWALCGGSELLGQSDVQQRASDGSNIQAVKASSPLGASAGPQRLKPAEESVKFRLERKG